MNRVVITGMGIYSCIGKNLDEVKESLYTGNYHSAGAERWQILFAGNKHKSN